MELLVQVQVFTLSWNPRPANSSETRVLTHTVVDKHTLLPAIQLVYKESMTADLTVLD